MTMHPDRGSNAPDLKVGPPGWIRVIRRTFLTAALWLGGLGTAAACPVCVGVSDSPLASGMNAGVLVLLGVTTMVLGGILVVGRRVARLDEASAEPVAARPEGRAYESGRRSNESGPVGPTFRSGGTELSAQRPAPILKSPPEAGRC